jgi:1-acyl-sn-glycerol-3-phosphate acyltransferase
MSWLRGPFGRSLRAFERKILEALFRLLFIYDCRGQQNIPVTGAAVVASNHPSYLDGILLSLRVRRPIRFMAWEQLFNVPIVGFLLRSFGAFPVSSGKGKGREAFEQAKALVKAGKVIGIFPEGRRSESGRLNPGLREGAARLAFQTGAPLIPACITGAYRAWPYFRPLPRPARIRVRFQRPIDPSAYRHLPEEEAVDAIMEEWRKRVERTLNPGAKADERIVRIYRRRAPWPRLHELALAVGVSTLLFMRSGSWLYQVAPTAYIAFLIGDRRLFPQRRLVKWLRNTSPLVFLLAFGPAILEALGLPEVPAGRALAATLVGALIPYFYERASIALGYVRGLVAAALFELLALRFAPSGLGPHVALPFYAAYYAAWEKTVFWRFAVPLLGFYAIGASWYMGGGPELLPHAAAGFGAWALSTLFPYRRKPVPSDDESMATAAVPPPGDPTK